MAKTQETMLPEFDYLTPEYVQHSVEHTYLQKVKPTQSLVHGQPLEFSIAESKDYTALHDTKLEVVVKVTKAKKADASDHATDKVCVANNLLHTMFESIELKINGENKEEIKLYPYRAYLDTITSHRHDALNIRGSLQGWAKDTVGKFDIVEYTAGAGGILARTEPYGSSAEVTLMGHLHGDIMSQGLCIPPNTPMFLRLKQASNDFALMAASAKSKGYELHIQDANLWVARVVANPSLEKVHNALFARQNPMLSMRQVGLRTFQVSAGIKETTLTNIFSGDLPDRFLVGLLSNGSLGGAINANPFFFQNFGVTFLQASVGGKHIPAVPYEPDFTSSRYIREYLALLEEFNADEGDATIDISKEEFKGGYSLFPFRIVPRSRGGDILGPVASGSVSLDLKFAANLTEVVNVLVYYEKRGKVELTKPDNEKK